MYSARLLCSAALAAAVVPAMAHADDTALRGHVVDAVSGAPIAGATVMSAAGETTTDDQGSFVVSGNAAPTGALEVLVYADGYTPQAVPVAAGARGDAYVALTGDVAGEVIEVVDDAPAPVNAASYALDRATLRALPGASNDILRALQSLPGVARMPYGLGGLVLRGTSPRDSNVYLDGIEVPAAFHFAAVSSFFPSALLDEVTMVPGGGDVAWGRSVGGVVDLRSRAPRGDRWRVAAEVGLLDAQTSIEGPTPGGGALVVSVRRSYVDAVLGAVRAADDYMLPRYYDGQLRWDQTVAGGTLTALGFFSDDLLVTGDSQLASHFARAALRYRRQVGDTTSTTTAWIGRDRLAFTGHFADGSASDLDRATSPYGVRSDVVRATSWGQLAVGIDAQGGHVVSSRDITLPTGLMDNVDVGRSYLDLAAWGEARWRLAEGRLTVRPGARVDHYELTDDWTFDPRLVVSHELGAGVTLRESLGVHHQPPSPSDLELSSDMDRRATRGIHASVGADVELPGSVRVSVTGFHVALDGVAVSDPDAGPQIRLDQTSGTGVGALARELVDDQLSTYVFQDSVGRGRTWGTEVSLVRRSDRWLAWLAYTLSRAERTGDPAREPGWSRYEFDQTHNLTAVGSLRLGQWQLGTRLRYASGNPRLAPAADLAPGDVSRPVPTGDRLPDYVSLDVRADRTWRRSWGTVSAFVDVQNVTAASNVEDVMVEPGRTRTVRGLPTFPSFGVAFQPAD